MEENSIITLCGSYDFLGINQCNIEILYQKSY